MSLTHPSGASACFMGGFAGLPPSIAQAFLTGLRSRMAECSEDLQYTLQKAMDEGRLTEGGPAMELFRAAATNLSTAQHMATNLAAPLATAEKCLLEFKAAVGHNTSDFGAGGSQEDNPFRRLKDLLEANKNEATQAETNAIEATFWNADIARHYRERAEILEKTFSENGDEHAVFVLLEADWGQAKTAFTDCSRSGSHLSGASHVHRDAMNRLFKLINTIRDIPGLAI